METVDHRLAARVEREGTCLVWIGCRRAAGYGQIRIGRKAISTHRAAWASVFGPIPDGLHVLHRCDNPPCCNPLHLFLGTVQDNSDDKVAKGRQPRGTANGFCRHSEDTIRRIRELRGEGWTQDAIAAEVGASQSHVSRVLLGELRSVAAT